jgi:hypothetical protein
MAVEDGELDWNNYLWLFVSVVFIFLVGRNWGTFDAFPINWFIVLIVVFGYFAGEGGVWLSRYHMAWFTCDGAAGSFNLNHGPREVIDSYTNKKTGEEVQFSWLVYGLGAFNFPLPKKGKIETVIVPKLQTDMRFKNHQCKTKVAPVPFSSLSMFPSLYNELCSMKEDFNLEKIKIGWHMSDFKYIDLKDLHLRAQMETQGVYTNMLKEAVNNKFDQFEETKEIFERMTDQPGILDRVGSFFSGGSRPSEN